MDNGFKESLIEKYPNPITIKETNKIIEQMQKCVCKIFGSGKGSGFFCNIPFENSKIPAFITNYHLINEFYIKNNKAIHITLNDDQDNIIIQLGINREIYLSQKYDTTIIQIIPSIDKINNFLELEDNLFMEKSENFYQNQSIYIMQYPRGQNVSVSYGVLNNISNYDIFHFCCTEVGSSGSPILSLLNKKVIGIHKGGLPNPKLKFNMGTFLKFPIKEYINNIKNKYNNFKPIENNYCLGLENIGGTVYMNSTLQCLCHISSFKNYFQNKNLIIKDINNKNAPLTTAFYELVNKLWGKSNETYYAPYNINNLIITLNPLLRGIQNNDPKDLICFIYGTLHYELSNPESNNNNILNNINNQNIPEELKLFLKNYYSAYNSIITKIFYSIQSSNLLCCSCNKNKISYNIINCLIFPLEKIRLYLEKKKQNGFQYVTLEDCFEQNELKELLTGQNQIYCNNCRKHSNAFSFNKLYNCPEVLTIILNRGKEFTVEFKFPLFFNIQKYLIDQSCNANFELIGVLTHLDFSGMNGHFIAYCKSPVDKQWYRYNDVEVSKCFDVENEIKSNGIPYILYYQRYQINENLIAPYTKKKSKPVYNFNINNKNIFVLYFKCGEKVGYIELTGNELNELFYEIANKIKKKYNYLPQEANFYLMKNNNMINIDMNKGLKENNIKNGDKIWIVQ